MMNYPKLVLKKDKDYPIRQKHHWIFSGAVQSFPKVSDGEIVSVYSSKQQFLGYAFINTKSQIIGRMIDFENIDPFEHIKNKIVNAYELRKKLFKEEITNSYRLVNSEGDGISGLTIDKYSNALVIQISSLGLERIKHKIVDILVSVIKPDIIFEKSNMPARKNEGLSSSEGTLYEKQPKSSMQVQMRENNILFNIDLQNSHKTGFYLDQREMRKLVGEMSLDKKVLNCFSYTGGFSLYAAVNGAKAVCSIDISREVIDQAKENFDINGLKPSSYEFLTQDVFKYLSEQQELNYDFVILDPPAFAKKKSDYYNALRGYGQINRLAMQKIKPKSFLLTCSCSYHVDEESFKQVISKSAHEAKRNVKIISSHRIASDHTINVFHPELNYLKSFLLYVE